MSCVKSKFNYHRNPTNSRVSNHGHCVQMLKGSLRTYLSMVRDGGLISPPLGGMAWFQVCSGQPPRGCKGRTGPVADCSAPCPHYNNAHIGAVEHRKRKTWKMGLEVASWPFYTYRLSSPMYRWWRRWASLLINCRRRLARIYLMVHNASSLKGTIKRLTGRTTLR